jgi:tetratricopeptide (TPR) repeat protein
MAEIWLANDRQADSTVALKFLSQSLAGERAYRDLLHKEWQASSRLMHAHILRVFEFHDDPDGAYYSMQFIGGPPLSVLAGAAPALVLRPIGLIADALRYAHGKDVIHRDIKASNILLDRRGAPYLSDFGVASVSGASATGGSEIGASPQQRAGEAAQPADDIYALGVLIVEMLDGVPPEADPVTGELRPVSSSNREIPDELSVLLDDMLATDPARRPHSEAVAERLRAAGIAPGPAPASMIGQYLAPEAKAVDDTVESIQPVRRAAPAATPDAAVTADSKSGGISQKMLYGGLAGSFVLFLAVIFLLPKVVQDDAPPTVPASTDEGMPDAATADSEDPNVEPAAEQENEFPLPGMPAATEDGDSAGFSENVRDFSGNTEAQIKSATDEVLGDLLSALERLKYRGIERWGGQPYLDALDVYAEGDRAYLSNDYRLAYQRYRRATSMLDPFFDRIDQVFEETLAAAQEAFDNGNHREAVRLFDLAVAVTPGNAVAEAGLKRALSLESVLRLMDQGLQFETDLELDAAKQTFEQALELDPAWDPARVALQRIKESIRLLSFEQRMTEGLDALAAGAYETARAAFNAAKSLNPNSRQPADGLLQVDQEVRLSRIRQLESQATTLDDNEEWETAIALYSDILEIDGDLQFAQEGLVRAQSRAALHNTLQSYISNPDALSKPATMQQATNVLLGLSRVSPIGPRLGDQKGQLTRLLKRAATPLKVMLVSDSATSVSIFRIGKLGSFSTHELDLRPGIYVATGSRAGYRDVRLEFRVAPEVEMKPVVVQCEEQI